MDGLIPDPAAYLANIILDGMRMRHHSSSNDSDFSVSGLPRNGLDGLNPAKLHYPSPFNYLNRQVKEPFHAELG